MEMAELQGRAPLAGVTIVEFAGLGPAPFCGMLLAGLGATVIRVDRPLSDADGVEIWRGDIMGRSKLSIALDLKEAASQKVAAALIARADVLLEGYRPGVMERLGFGPDKALALNSKLVYARMTGWGQTGPLADRAGHDLNYISLAGVLGMIGEQGGPPVIPLNLIGDFGGGGMYMAFAIASALVEVSRGGSGVVIDAAMAEGASTLATMIFGMLGEGTWREARQSNLLDGGCPFYSVYRCQDGKYMGVAALEAKFFAILVERLGLSGRSEFASQFDVATWPAMRQSLTDLFAGHPRAYFEGLMVGTDACTFPVLSAEEAIADPHNQSRGAFVEIEGVWQPAPGPLFDGLRPTQVKAGPSPDQNRAEILAMLGIDAAGEPLAR